MYLRALYKNIARKGSWALTFLYTVGFDYGYEVARHIMSEFRLGKKLIVRDPDYMNIALKLLTDAFRDIGQRSYCGFRS